MELIDKIKNKLKSTKQQELEELLEAYKSERNRIRLERDELKRQVKEMNQICRELEKTNSNLSSSNERMIVWIKEILECVKTCETKSRNSFVIPIYKEEERMYNYMERPRYRKTIVIPELIIKEEE